jgi:hypothetical protein
VVVGPASGNVWEEGHTKGGWAHEGGICRRRSGTRNRAHAALYAGRRVVIDAEEDALADGFSAEVELGWRFVLRSTPAGAAT